MFEDKLIVAPTFSIRSLLTWRRCTKCSGISYCPPDSTCKCGGRLGRQPGWKTMFAPKVERVHL